MTTISINLMNAFDVPFAAATNSSYSHAQHFRTPFVCVRLTRFIIKVLCLVWAVRCVMLVRWWRNRAHRFRTRFVCLVEW